MTLVGLDIGGANLKLADGRERVLSQPFALWKQPQLLAESLAALVAQFPEARQFAVTMTGELADCFATKAEGVRTILDAVERVAAGRTVLVYLTDGSFVSPQIARQHTLLAAASNWHALARLAGNYAPQGNAMLIDIGSTTTDLIPLVDGQPAAEGRTDPERLSTKELVYTGVTRSPICAIRPTLPWRDRACGVAQELFATTLDVYLTLGELPEEPDNLLTADGRPATRMFALDRLARMICADRDMFTPADAIRAASAIALSQSLQIATAARAVVGRMSSVPVAVVLSGSGEFLARSVLSQLEIRPRLVSLCEQLGPVVSQSAPAYAVAVLAAEQGFGG